MTLDILKFYYRKRRMQSLGVGAPKSLKGLEIQFLTDVQFYDTVEGWRIVEARVLS